MRLVEGLFERGFSTGQIRQLYRLIEGLMALPAPLSDLAWEEIRDFAKEKHMPFMTGAERYGRREARKHLLAGIEVGLELKFGAAGLVLLAEIDVIEDPELLWKILQAVKEAESPEALRRLWTEA